MAVLEKESQRWAWRRSRSQPGLALWGPSTGSGSVCLLPSLHGASCWPLSPSPANLRVSFPQPEVGPRRPRLLSVCCHLPLITDFPRVLSWPTLSPVSPLLTAPGFCAWPHWLHPSASLFPPLPSLFCGEHPDLTHILQQQETDLRVWELTGAPRGPR